jgi:lysophospholipase L1-like esterase
MGGRYALLSLPGRSDVSDGNSLSPVRITFFGDSIFVGQGVSIYRGWVTQIAQYLDDYGSRIGREFLVTNASVNGRTTRQALEDMPYSVQSHGVDILVVQFGLNDCNYWATDLGLPRVSVGAFRENLREIIQRGFNVGACRVIFNNNHPTSRSTDLIPRTKMTYEDSNLVYCDEIRSLASDLGQNVHFQDVHRYFTEITQASGRPIDNYLLADGLHLSFEGHNAYYRLMQPVIIKAVEEFLAQPTTEA